MGADELKKLFKRYWITVQIAGVRPHVFDLLGLIGLIGVCALFLGKVSAQAWLGAIAPAALIIWGLGRLYWLKRQREKLEHEELRAVFWQAQSVCGLFGKAMRLREQVPSLEAMQEADKKAALLTAENDEFPEEHSRDRNALKRSERDWFAVLDEFHATLSSFSPQSNLSPEAYNLIQTIRELLDAQKNMQLYAERLPIIQAALDTSLLGLSHLVYTIVNTANEVPFASANRRA